MHNLPNALPLVLPDGWKREGFGDNVYCWVLSGDRLAVLSGTDGSMPAKSDGWMIGLYIDDDSFVAGEYVGLLEGDWRDDYAPELFQAHIAAAESWANIED